MFPINIGKWKKDKVYHFIAGWLIYVFTMALFVKLNVNHQAWCYRVVILVGAGKELVYDKYMKQGVPSLGDFTWTMIGGIVADLTTFWWFL